MKYSKLLVSLSIILLIGACRKKDIKPFDDSQPVLATDYFPMKAGNYWIYEEFETDTNGTVTPLNVFDTVYVVGDTIINGKNYWKIKDTGYPFTPIPPNIILYEADGSQLKMLNGDIQLSSNNFTTPLYTSTVMSFSGKDTAYIVTLQMTDRGATVKVKGGSFVSITAKTSFLCYPANYCDAARLFPVRKSIYAYKVGMIYRDLPGWCVVPNLKYQELVRYHLN